MIYLLTDTHYNHVKKMMEYCDRPEDYEAKIDKGLSNLKPDDLLIHLGDVCIGKDDDNNRRITSKPFKKWLVKGNHDKKSDKWYLEHGWDWVGDSMTLSYGGLNILLSHVPQELPVIYKPKGTDQMDINIHGHFHNTNHRNNEPHVERILSDKHILLALEYDGYLPLSLESIINKYRRNHADSTRA